MNYMPRHLRSAVVLGAGAMGSQIAAHLANAGVRVRLLDLSVEAAQQGLARCVRFRPDPFFVATNRLLITCGAFEDTASAYGDADWIIEAVIEQADAKRVLLEARRSPSEG